MIKEVQNLAEVILTLSGEREVFVVHDANLAWVSRELPWPAFSLATSEEGKTLDTVQEFCRWLLAAGATRGALLLSVGGGITSDMAGFAASIYKRGIRYANLPTTLLAQVDAAIGGKTGVNLDGYKNMLGAFRMPEYTFLWAGALRTLPPREWRCGLAEMLKTFLIGDAQAYVRALKGVDGELITRAAQIKAEIVERDPFEKGERAKLNLGHTFGHAIEHEARLRGDDIAHGEAVAMGIILAASLTDKALAERLKQDFASLDLPTESPYPVKDLVEAMHKDKKAVGTKVKFVLLRAPGDVFLEELTPEEAYDRYLHTT